MNQQDVQRRATSTKHAFQTVLNERNWLFESQYIEIPEPKVSKGGQRYVVDIPPQKLKGNLGLIRASLTYGIVEDEVRLISYGFDFTHSHTFIWFQEKGRYNDEVFGQTNYGFHFDMDIENEKKIVHPLYHLQFLSFSVPRFEMIDYKPELLAFKNMLDVIQLSFYKDSRTSDRQSPKLTPSYTYLTQYQ